MKDEGGERWRQRQTDRQKDRKTEKKERNKEKESNKARVKESKRDSIGNLRVLHHHYVSADSACKDYTSMSTLLIIAAFFILPLLPVLLVVTSLAF